MSNLEISINEALPSVIGAKRYELDGNVHLTLLISIFECQRVPGVQRVPADDVVRVDQKMADLFVPDVLPVHHLHRESRGRVADRNGVLLIPNRVQLILQEGGFEQLHLCFRSM